MACALLHDIGDTLGSYNHADIAAAVLEPFVSDANHWMVQQHAVFQGYYFFHHLGLDRDAARPLRRPRVLRPHGLLLRGVRPAGVRSRLRHAAAGALRAGRAGAVRDAPPQHLRARGRDRGALRSRPPGPRRLCQGDRRDEQGPARRGRRHRPRRRHARARARGLRRDRGRRRRRRHRRGRPRRSRPDGARPDAAHRGRARCLPGRAPHVAHPDRHAHRPRRHHRRRRRPRARGRRLRDQAVRAGRAGRPHPLGPAPGRRRLLRRAAATATC